MNSMLRWFSPPPAIGDRIVTTAPIPSGFLSPPHTEGTSGVVVDTDGRRLVVELDTGWGLASATLRPHQCRVVARDMGRPSFVRRSRAKLTLRLIAILIVTAPIARYLFWYLVMHGSFDGLAAAAAVDLLASAGDTLLFAFTDPIGLLISAAIGTITWWIAFGLPRRNSRQ